MIEPENAVDTLIVHGLVVTLDREDRVLEDGAVAVRGTDIVDVGPSAALSARFAASAGEVVDASGRLVMPGLINAHTHAADALFRGLIDDLPLEPWLARLWVAERRFLNPETVRLGTRLALAEMIRAGVTAALDMFWFPESSIAVAREVGFRLLSGPIFFDGDDAPDGLSATRRFARAHELLEDLDGDPLIGACVLPHATYTVAPDRLREIAELAETSGALFSTHVSETETEVATVAERWGDRPPALLDRLGLLERRAVLAHCVHLDDGEVALLARRRATVAHCPLSNLKLGAGIAPIPALCRAGVGIALGTDGPVSSNDLDPWTAMRLAATLHKGVHRDPSLVPAPEVVGWATRDAARGLGLGDRVGVLAAGYEADLIVVDLARPHLVPRYDIFSHLVYAAGRDDVVGTMVRGRWLMRDRRLTTLDEAFILGAATALAGEIAKGVP